MVWYPYDQFYVCTKPTLYSYNNVTPVANRCFNTLSKINSIFIPICKLFYDVVEYHYFLSTKMLSIYNLYNYDLFWYIDLTKRSTSVTMKKKKLRDHDVRRKKKENRLKCKRNIHRNHFHPTTIIGWRSR